MERELSTQQKALRLHLGKVLSAHREQMSHEGLQALQSTDFSLKEAREAFDQIEDFQQETILTAVDLLVAWLKSSDPAMETLLEGWVNAQWPLLILHGKASELTVPQIMSALKRRWLQALNPYLGAELKSSLMAVLDAVVEHLSMPTRETLRILYVGDCLMPEIMTSLNGPCVRSQIALTQTFLHDHLPTVLRNQIRALDKNDFDLVFYSPFTHTFSSEYASLQSWKASFWSRKRFMTMLDEMLAAANTTVQTLQRHFACPVYVHNTAGTVQAFGLGSGLLKTIGAMRNGGTIRALVQKSLARALSQSTSDHQLRLLDEDSLRSETSAWTLGKVFFHGMIFHPTMLGVQLGQKLYHDAAYSAAYLATKKVVVCDLDNTLWEGVIGEGAVKPYAGRQQILAKLRKKGVLLSINSKNDPANVHFTGSELQFDDFVAPRINWEAKSSNLGAISAELNLNVKHFVFIDDRADELERVQQAFPDLLVLNAEEPSTWRYLSHWEQFLTASSEEDRTRMYQERLAREAFVTTQEHSVTVEDEAAAFAELDLQVTIQNVKRPDLKRIAELINRTNQFNLCGSRTTVADLEAGLGQTHFIVSVSAKDRFGSMGVVGAMQVNVKEECLEIPVFVLSCRVFGFGIEYALLNAVKTLVPQREKIIGLYKETRSNGPCRQLYPKSNFIWKDDCWVGLQSELGSTPNWLKVTTNP